MSNLNLQKLHEWVWPWPWTFNKLRNKPLDSNRKKLTAQQLDRIVVTHSWVQTDRCIMLIRYGTSPGFCKKK